MFFKKQIIWLFILATVIIYNYSIAGARSAHDVTIRIAEIGRYRIENSSIITSGKEVIQTVNVAILSNSERGWRFVAVPVESCGELEWSEDNRIWHKFDSGETVILTGTKSNWESYRFYFRIQGTKPSNGIKISYQLLFND